LKLSFFMKKDLPNLIFLEKSPVQTGTGGTKETIQERMEIVKGRQILRKKLTIFDNTEPIL